MYSRPSDRPTASRRGLIEIAIAASRLPTVERVLFPARVRRALTYRQMRGNGLDFCNTF
jgi:hypothetical protein